jgi:acetylornithine deacetylase/succinyl-diaminopimelate desuccinylase-like protein
MITPETHPIIQKYRHVAEAILGEPVVLNKEHGSTDGAHLPPASTVILHQPTDAHIHGKGEYTTIDELEKIYEIYKRFIQE